MSSPPLADLTKARYTNLHASGQVLLYDVATPRREMERRTVDQVQVDHVAPEGATL